MLSGRNGGFLALVLIALLGGGLLALGLRSGSETVPGTSGADTSPYFGVTTAPSGGTTTSETSEIQAGDVSLTLPNGASGIEQHADGDRRQVSFTLGKLNGQLSTQNVLGGQSLDDLVSLYNQPGELKRLQFGHSNKGYLIERRDPQLFTLTAIGRLGEQDIFLQLSGPLSQLPQARSRIKNLTAALIPNR